MVEGYDPLAEVHAAGPPGSISFVYGLPDPATFPVGDLGRAVDCVLRERAAIALQYGPQQGYGPLIDYLRGKMSREEGLAVERRQIKLTGGSTQALDHICTLYTRAGDTVLVEAPTYHETLDLFRDHHLEAVQVPIDGQGLLTESLSNQLEDLARVGKRARFLYLIPNHQNPAGITLAEDRRRQVLDLAERFDLHVIEDDVYRDLTYEGRVPPSLFALDGGRRVLRIGTFSKILAPAMRLGWLLGPDELIEEMVWSGLRNMGGGANPLIANALAVYCQRGLLEPHIEYLLEVYRRRRDLMLATLQRAMPQGTSWTRPAGGFFIWLSLPAAPRASAVVEAAAESGILVLPGGPFFAQAPTGQYLRLSYSYVPPEKIEDGIQRLADVLRDLLDG